MSFKSRHCRSFWLETAFPWRAVPSPWGFPASSGPESRRWASASGRSSADATGDRGGMGDRGCLSLFGTSPEHHRLFAEHLTAEYRVATQERGRTVEEWKQRPERSDNHWFDCLVGCAAAASIQGAVLTEAGGRSQSSKRERISFAELQRRRHA